MAMTENRRARLVDVALPDFGMPATEPLLPASIYAERIERLRAAMGERGYDHIVVWGDREHSANIAYLTGFDPPFEEAVLIVGPGDDPATEPSYSATSATAWERRRRSRCDRQVPGSQPARPGEDRSRPLAEILAAEGIGMSSRVGIVGWKTYSKPGDDRSSGLPRRRVEASHRSSGTRRETRPTCSSTPPTASGSSTRSNSSPRSSGPPARRRPA